MTVPWALFAGIQGEWTVRNPDGSFLMHLWADKGDVDDIGTAFLCEVDYRFRTITLL